MHPLTGPSWRAANSLSTLGRSFCFSGKAGPGMCQLSGDSARLFLTTGSCTQRLQLAAPPPSCPSQPFSDSGPNSGMWGMASRTWPPASITSRNTSRSGASLCANLVTGHPLKSHGGDGGRGQQRLGWTALAGVINFEVITMK